MPKNLFQEIVFTLIMVFVMVYAMICYNIALDVKGLQNFIFKAAFSELWYMGLIAFVLELLVVGPLAKKLAFRVLNPASTAPLLITLAISAITVCFMCPIMSLAATIIIKQPAAADFIAVWLQTTAFNFPMALCWQIFYAGPFVRLLFRCIFVYPARSRTRKAVGSEVNDSREADNISANQEACSPDTSHRAADKTNYAFTTKNSSVSKSGNAE